MRVEEGLLLKEYEGRPVYDRTKEILAPYRTEFRDRLLRKGFMVRDCSTFGLPEHIRIGPRSMEDCRRLVGAIREISG